MDMIYHVLPGDSVAREFRKTDIDGKTVICREALIAGPIDADTIFEFWDQRARFILAEYGEDEIGYHDTVADELAKLLDMDEDAEVNLWFEYELFCSVNMWFCLSLLRETGATVYRVEPIGLDEANRWDGFGKFDGDDLKACYELRTKMTAEDIELGTALWNAYRRGDHSALENLAKQGSPCFPHLREVVAAAVVQDIEPLETVKAIKAGGEADFERIFFEFKKRAGVYGYGDLQVQRLLEKIEVASS